MSDERHETVADNVSANHQFREVAKMIQHEEVDVSKMETTTPTCEKSSAVGNAAAPDLYKSLLGLLEIVCVDCNSSYKVDGKCVKCPRVVAAEAAIAKAGGAK